MIKKLISEEEVKHSHMVVCKNCKHTLNYHIFFDHEKRLLEVSNCNECFQCEGFEG